MDPLAWHAGCFVRGAGVTRWALQKFKERPKQLRATPAAFWEVMDAHMAAAAAHGRDAAGVVDGVTWL